MKELKKTRRLIIASVIFLMILVTGFITFKQPENKYDISAKEMLAETGSTDQVVSPDELELTDIILVDLRNSNDFNKGTIDGAINIPVSDILNEDVISQFNEWQNRSETVVLFAGDQQAANAPWMILRQLGFSNLKVLAGGYSVFSSTQADSDAESLDLEFNPEIPVLDFAGFIEEATGEEVEAPKSEPAQIIPVRREKKTVTAGGC